MRVSRRPGPREPDIELLPPDDPRSQAGAALSPAAGLWGLVLSGPILLFVAGVALLAGMSLANALWIGVFGQAMFVIAVLGISARNRTLNARDAASYWGTSAEYILASGPPHPYLRPAQPTVPRAAPHVDAAAAPMAEPQWWVFPARQHIDPAAPTAPAAACVARPSEQSRLMCEWLSELGLDAHHCADIGAMLGAVADMPGRWALVIIDLDHLGCLEDAIEDLLDFRETSPGVPVILLSAGVARDDLSAERLTIADATLRKPVFARSFAGSLATVKENNRIWQMRCGDPA